jgi:hypothetical protein
LLVRAHRCAEGEISPETPRRACILLNPCPFPASCTTYPHNGYEPPRRCRWRLVRWPRGR